MDKKISTKKDKTEIISKLKEEPFLNIKDLSVHFTNGKHINKAVDHVDLHINKGEVVSIVGESGSGKSTIARATLSLWPHASGSITHKGRVLPTSPALRKRYGSYKWIAKNMQMIFQDPYESLHPTWTVYKVATQGIKYNSDFKSDKEKFKLTKEIQFHENFFKYTNKISKMKEANSLKKKYIKGMYDLKDKIQNEKASWHAQSTLYKNRVHSLKLEVNAAKKLKKETETIELADRLSKYKEKYKAHKLVKLDTKKYEDDIDSLKVEVNNQVAEWEKFVVKKDYKRKEMDSNLSKVITMYKEKLDIRKKAISSRHEKIIQKLKEESNKNESLIKFEKKKEHQAIVGAELEFSEKLNEAKIKEVNKIGSDEPYIAAKYMNYLLETKFSRSGKKNYIYQKVSLFLKKVGINSSILSQPISDLSGGQRQRIAIARSLVMNPRFLIADEPISALDVSIQAQVINILKDLKDEFDLTIMFIAHDLRMVRYISDRVYIMFRGKIVEHGDIEEIFKKPVHPYTKTLLSSIPSININRKGLKSYQYDLSTNLKERHTHDFHKVGTKEHFVLGTKELIKKWTSETKVFLKEFDYN